MPAIVGLGIDAIDVAHQARQIGLPRLQHKMVMVAHEAIGIDHRIEAVHALLDYGEQGGAIHVVLEDRLASIPSCSHVIQRTFKL